MRRKQQKNGKMKKTNTFVLSDETVNTYGFRLLTSGADLEQFKRNPVLYFDHNVHDLPLGRWENIRVEGDKILADPVFDMEDEKGREIGGKVDRGFLCMASVGFRVIETSEDPGTFLPGQTGLTVTKWILREVSIVGIGSNHNALRLYDENDRALGDDEILQLFDMQQPKKQIKMKKETLEILNLADKPTDEMIEAAVLRLHGEKEKALADKAAAEKKADEVKIKLEAIEAADRAAKKTEAGQLVDAAIKDGRLSEKEDGSVKKAWMALFDGNHENAKTMLEGLPRRQSPAGSLKLGDEGGKRKESEWEKRRKEIEGRK